MTDPTIHRVFEVEARLEDAWRMLADVERWPEWAPHILSVSVSPPGALGPTSSGAFTIRRLGRNDFRMSVWEPPVRWEWVVELRGPLAPFVRPLFARIYGRNVDRAIPRLQEWFRVGGSRTERSGRER